MSTVNRTRIFLAIILALTLVCYAPALRNGFVQWDDTRYLDAPAIQKLDRAHLAAVFGDFYQGNYIPLTFFSFALEKACGAETPRSFILANIIFHLLNTLLVFAFVRLLLRFPMRDKADSSRDIAALVAALLFGIHPLHVESVAWIAERKDVLYAFFFLSSIIAYLYFVRSKKAGWFLLALAAMLLSALSKTMGIALTFSLVAIDIFLGRSYRERRLWLEKIPFLCITAVFACVGMNAVHHGAADLNSYSLSFMERGALASYAFFNYIAKLFLPVSLSAYYPYPMAPGQSMPAWVWLFPLLIIALMILLFVFRHKRIVVFGTLFFAFNIFMALQFFPVGDSLMGDRFVYIAALGLFIPAGQVCWNFFECKRKRTAPVLLLSVVSLLFIYVSRERCKKWKDAETLWTDVIAQYDNVPMAYTNRGNALFQEGNVNGALADYDHAIALHHGTKDAYYNRAVVLFQNKQYDKAAADFSEVIKLDAGDKDALYDRALCYIYSDKKKEALNDLNGYIKLDPGSADAYGKRGVMRIQLGDSLGACDDWRKAAGMGSAEAKNALEHYCK